MLGSTAQRVFQLAVLASCVTLHIALGLMALAAAVAVYRLFLHPLATVPGPKWAAVSNMWHALHVRNGRVGGLARTLHQKYGPMVRVGPNEVWFNSKEAFDQIYCPGKGFEKSDFYLATCLNKPRINWLMKPHFEDSLDLLSERDMKRYRVQRRLVGRIYHASNVARYEQVLDGVVQRAVTELEAMGGQEVDLAEWMHIIAVECLGACVLSWSPGLIKRRSDGGTLYHGHQAWRRKSVFGLFPLAAKLELVWPGFGRAFAKLLGVTYKTPAGFRSFFPDVGRRVLRRIKSGPRRATGRGKGQNVRDDLMGQLVGLHQENAGFSQDYLKKMAVTNFGAGHETLASTLTSTLAMISSRAAVQKQMREEMARQAGPACWTRARAPVYTRAAIKEAMRLCPVMGMSLPRVTPAGGMRVHGRWFGPGTIVGCNPVALQRNQDVFGLDAGCYRPERWLDDRETRAMERYMLIWGGGARMCPGRPLAELVVYKVVTGLVERFNMDVGLPGDECQPSYFLCLMTGVKARFRAIEGAMESC
ncbi:hypothetical protein CDD82_3620 [Ophiocordyceps australis]|uniref:Cytochrome P450 n=1 Tax=Ophiocordyceps australis TaxID=1399860 RepID=A0A2C5ZM49_9HYPO|nr:hypothetical protein CDD82_3620 [Ophiocordyceps australis]